MVLGVIAMIVIVQVEEMVEDVVEAQEGVNGPCLSVLSSSLRVPLINLYLQLFVIVI